MKFMVTPKDGVDANIRSSQHFPTIVEADSSALPHEILERCFATKFAPRDGKQYYIVPMTDAVLVTCKYRREFDYVISFVK